MVDIISPKYVGLRLSPTGDVITRTIVGEVISVGIRTMKTIPSNYVHGNIVTGYLEEVPYKNDPATPYIHVYNNGVEIPTRLENTTPVGSTEYCLNWETGILFLDKDVAWGTITADYYGAGSNVNWERILIQDVEDGPGDASTNIGKYIRVDSTGKKHEYAVGPGGATALDDLSDVSLSAPITDGQVLTYDDYTGQWVNESPTPAPAALNDLTDVTITGETDGQVLTYDDYTGQWINQSPTPTPSALNDLTDVTITGETDGQVLTYDDYTGQWINKDATGGSGEYNSVTGAGNSPDDFLYRSVGTTVFVKSPALHDFEGHENEIAEIDGGVAPESINFRKLDQIEYSYFNKEVDPTDRVDLSNSCLIEIDGIEYIAAVRYKDEGDGVINVLLFAPDTKEFIRTISIRLDSDFYPDFVHPLGDWSTTYFYKIATRRDVLYLPFAIRITPGTLNQIYVLAFNFDAGFRPHFIFGRELLTNAEGVPAPLIGTKPPTYPDITLFNDGVSDHLRVATNTTESIGGSTRIPANTEVWKISVVDGSNYTGISGRSYYILNASIPTYLSVLQDPVYSIESGTEYVYCKNLELTAFSQLAEAYFSLVKYELGAALAPVKTWGGVFYGEIPLEANVMTVLFGGTPACGYHAPLTLDDYVYVVSNRTANPSLLSIHKISITDGSLVEVLTLNDYVSLPSMGGDFPHEFSGHMKLVMAKDYFIAPISTYTEDGYLRLHLWTVNISDFTHRYFSDGKVFDEVSFKLPCSEKSWAVANSISVFDDSIFSLLFIKEYKRPGEELDSVNYTLVSYLTPPIAENSWVFSSPETGIYKTEDTGEEIEVTDLGVTYHTNREFSNIDLASTVPSDEYLSAETKILVEYPPQKSPLKDVLGESWGIVKVDTSEQGASLTLRDRVYTPENDINEFLPHKGLLFDNSWFFSGCFTENIGSLKILFSRIRDDSSSSSDQDIDLAGMLSTAGFSVSGLTLGYVFSVVQHPTDSDKLIATAFFGYDAPSYHIGHFEINKPSFSSGNFSAVPASGYLSSNLTDDYEPSDSILYSISGTDYIGTYVGDKFVEYNISTHAFNNTTAVDLSSVYIKNITLYADGISVFVTFSDSGVVSCYNITTNTGAYDWTYQFPKPYEGASNVYYFDSKIYTLTTITTPHIYASELWLYVLDAFTGDTLNIVNVSKKYRYVGGVNNPFGDIFISGNSLYVRYSGKLADYTGNPEDSDYYVLIRELDISDDYSFKDIYKIETGIDEFTTNTSNYKDTLSLFNSEYIASYLLTTLYIPTYSTQHRGTRPVYSVLTYVPGIVYIDKKEGGRYQSIDSILQKVSDPLSGGYSGPSWANDTCPVTYGIENSSASCVCSTAIGHCTYAGEGSISIGRCVCSGCNAVNIGGSPSVGNSTVSIGLASCACGDGAIVIGCCSCAPSSTEAIAIGAGGFAGALKSVAIGCCAGVAGACGISIGSGAVSCCLGGVVIGPASVSAGDSSIVIGNTSCTNACSSVSLGRCTCNYSENGIAIGTFSTAGRNAYLCSAAIAIGISSFACGGASIAIGPQACSINTNAIAIGNATKALCTSSIVIGACSCAVLANDISIGEFVYSGGGSSTSIGTCSTSGGPCGIAMGYSTSVTCANGVAIGCSAKVIGAGGIAIGAGSCGGGASSPNSIAIGTSALSSCNSSIAIGNGACAPGDDAVVIGTGAVSSPASCCANIVIGKSACAVCSCNISIGYLSFGCGSGTVAIGAGACALAKSISIGENAISGCFCSIAIGFCSLSNNCDSVAIGFGAHTCGVCSVSIGACSTACQGTVAIGSAIDAKSNETVAIGTLICATGACSVSIGLCAKSTASSAVSIGTCSYSAHCCSVALLGTTKRKFEVSKDIFRIIGTDSESTHGIASFFSNVYSSGGYTPLSVDYLLFEEFSVPEKNGVITFSIKLAGMGVSDPSISLGYTINGVARINATDPYEDAVIILGIPEVVEYGGDGKFSARVSGDSTEYILHIEVEDTDDPGRQTTWVGSMSYVEMYLEIPT